MFDYKKVLTRCVKKHNAREKIRQAEWLAEGWNGSSSDPRPFEWSIPYKPRLKIFKLKRRSLVTFDPYTCEAVSYGHWVFVKVIQGKVVFNNYSYSNTTRRHQGMIFHLLSQLGIKIDLEVNQRESLSSGLNGSVETLQRSIIKNEIAASRKGARKTTKVAVKKAIKHCLSEIKILKSFGATLHVSSIQNIQMQEIRNEQRRLEEVKRKREQWKIDHKVEIEQRKFDRMVNS